MIKQIVMDIQQQNWQIQDSYTQIIYKISREISDQKPLLYKSLTINIEQMLQNKDEVNDHNNDVAIYIPIITESSSLNIEKLFQSQSISDVQPTIQCYSIGVNHYLPKNWWLVSNISNQALIIDYQTVQKRELNYFINSDILTSKQTVSEIYFGICSDKVIITIYRLKSDDEEHKIERLLMPQQKIVTLNWGSLIQLKYKLSVHSRRVQNNREFPLFHSQIVLSKNHIAFIYCRELMIYNAIETSANNNQEQFHSEILHLQNNCRFRYPRAYYSLIFGWYHNIKKWTMIKSPFIPFWELIKTIKYCLLENVDQQSLEHILNKGNTNLQSDNNVDIQSTIKQILQLTNYISDEQLKNDPINPTIIFYWLLGMPGCYKTQIYCDLQAKLELFSVRTLKLEQEAFIKNNQIYEYPLLSFFQRSDLFQYQRYSYVLLDVSFSEDRLQSLLEVIQGNLSKKIHYQLYLVTPDRAEEYKFQLQDISQTFSYCFPLDFILGAVLNIQRRNSHIQFNGNSVQSLAKILHYISSVYSNLNIAKLIEHSSGNVSLIEYQCPVKMIWQSVSCGCKEQIEDGLNNLLQTNYSSPVLQDPFLWYFLQNISEIEYHYNIEDIADAIISKTFTILPYIDIFHKT